MQKSLAKTLPLLQKVLRKLLPSRVVVFLDLEYINARLGSNQRPFPTDWKEIVQIGASLFDLTQRKEIQNLDLMVQPSIFGGLLTDAQWDHFWKLTHLTSAQCFSGQPFVNALKQLTEFVKTYPVVIMLGDADVLAYHVQMAGLTQSLDNWNFIKLKPVLTEIDSSTYTDMTSGQLSQAIGIDLHQIYPQMAQKEHNGLFDARSMAHFCNCAWNLSSSDSPSSDSPSSDSPSSDSPSSDSSSNDLTG